MKPFTLTHPVEDVHHKGDPLGRSYTPDACALAIVQRLAELTQYPAWTLEPCLGGGAFARAFGQVWPGVPRTGWDVDLTATGQRDVEHFIGGDARAMANEIATPPWPVTVAASCPPWGKDTPKGLTVEIVSAIRGISRVSAMLIPVDKQCQEGMEHEFDIAAEVWPLLPRPWEHDRGMCVLVHVQGRENEDTRLRPLRWRARG